MAFQCPKCKRMVELPPGAPLVCPQCKAAVPPLAVPTTVRRPGLPAAPAAASPASVHHGYSAPAGYQPVPPSAPPGSVVVRRTSGKAKAALILGIVSISLAGLSVISDEIFFLEGPVGVVIGLGALVLPILAVVFGAMGMKETKQPGVSGRGMAITGFVLGIIILAYVVVAIFIVLVLMLYYCMSGGPKCTAVAAPMALATCNTNQRNQNGPRLRGFLKLKGQARWDALFVHHPPGPRFDQDVYHLTPHRLCVGCFTMVPIFAISFGVLYRLAPGSWELWMVLGFVIGSAQFLSMAGWTTTKRRKIAVKTLLGVGLGMIAYSILLTPWSWPARIAFVMAISVLGSLVQLPRARRIARMAQA